MSDSTLKVLSQWLQSQKEFSGGWTLCFDFCVVFYDLHTLPPQQALFYSFALKTTILYYNTSHPALTYLWEVGLVTPCR